mmetsp:Transcript_44221/g.75265  ORF Transcript_44221/g.75265 Transcript_44221/m.75265 type:complete len:88 (+) Transcript_44221:62-325(+)
MIRNGITVCDFGAGTDAMLYKGVRMARPSMPCRKLEAYFPSLAAPPATLPPSAPPTPLSPPSLGSTPFLVKDGGYGDGGGGDNDAGL